MISLDGTLHLWLLTILFWTSLNVYLNYMIMLSFVVGSIFGAIQPSISSLQWSDTHLLA